MAIDYNDPYNTDQKQTQASTQDPSKVPAYPYLMSGQQGWPTINQQPQVPVYNGTSTTGQNADNATFGTPNYGTDQQKAGSMDWINSQLQAVQSTDDPNYWYGVMQKDPKVAAGDQSAINYWVDRIRRGDGSALVKSGQLSLYGGDTPGNVTPGQSASFSAAGSTSTPFTLGNYGNFGSPQATTLWDMLMGRAKQTLDVGAKDPVIAAQTNAFRAEQERAARNHMADLAEREGPIANLGLEGRMASEHAAQATGGLQAQLMQNELNARRQEIASALAQMGGMLSDEQRLAMQKELGLIDANLRQQQVTNQNNQFLDQLGLQATDLANTWDWRRSGGAG